MCDTKHEHARKGNIYICMYVYYTILDIYIFKKILI